MGIKSYILFVEKFFGEFNIVIFMRCFYKNESDFIFIIIVYLNFFY